MIVRWFPPATTKQTYATYCGCLPTFTPSTGCLLNDFSDILVDEVNECAEIISQFIASVITHVPFVQPRQSGKDDGNYYIYRVVRTWRLLAQVITSCVCVTRRQIRCQCHNCCIWSILRSLEGALTQICHTCNNSSVFNVAQVWWHPRPHLSN